MLFKDSNTVLQYAQLTGTINFLSIQPTLLMIEEVYIEDALGNELYGSLNSAYQLTTNELELTTAQQNLLEQCRKVIGRYLCYHYAPIAEIQVSESGARRSENNNSKTAFQYQVTNFRNENLRQAELYTEKLLQFLETNQSAYPEWLNSAAYKDYSSLFIKTAKDFDAQYKTPSPYRNYWAMRWKMRDVEEQHIKEVLTEPLFTDLKTKYNNPSVTLSDEEKALVALLKKAIAYLTVAFAVPHIGVRIDAMGITVAGPTTASQDDASKRTDARSDKVSLLISSCENAGRTWLKMAAEYLNKNAGKFTAYQPTTPPAASVVNDPYYTDVNNTYYGDALNIRPSKTNNADLNANINGAFGLP